MIELPVNDIYRKGVFTAKRGGLGRYCFLHALVAIIQDIFGRKDYEPLSF
jgi:hypothetical protein